MTRPVRRQLIVLAALVALSVVLVFVPSWAARTVLAALGVSACIVWALVDDLLEHEHRARQRPRPQQSKAESH